MKSIQDLVGRKKGTPFLRFNAAGTALGKEDCAVLWITNTFGVIHRLSDMPTYEQMKAQKETFGFEWGGYDEGSGNSMVG